MPQKSRFVRLRQAATVAAFAVVLGALALTTAGCHFAVQADPNDPLYGARSFALEPLTYANLFVGDKPEAVYLSGKSPDQQRSFETDKAETAQKFGEQLIHVAAAQGMSISVLSGAPPAAPPPFILRINFDFVEPGNFNGFVNIATQLRATLVVLNAQGQLLGQFPMNVVIPATLFNPSSGGRMREAGEQLGERAAHYLLRRAGLGY